MPRKNVKEYYKQKKENNICLYCTEPAKDGKNRCVIPC